MAQLLQAQTKFDALWNHDDDQGVGALRAIEQAGRDEFLMVGGAGATSAMDAIKADNSVLKATVLYPPTMAASAIDLARALGQGKGVGGLAEFEIPASMTLYSAVVDQGQRRRVPADRLQVGPPRRLARRPPVTRRPTPARHIPDEGGARMSHDTAPATRPYSRADGHGADRWAWAWSATPSWAPPTPRAGAPSGRVFDLPLAPGLAAVCGRDAAAVRGGGRAGSAGPRPRPTGGP